MRHVQRLAVSSLFTILAFTVSLKDETACAKVSHETAYQPVTSASQLQDENFYVLTLLESDENVQRAMRDNHELTTLSTRVQTRAEFAAQACTQALETYAENPSSEEQFPLCDINQLRWTQPERDAALNAIGALYDSSPAIRNLVAMHMRPSRFYALYEDQDDRTLFMRAWTDAHAGIDRIIRVYGLGEPPRSDDIDSVIYPIEARYYKGVLASLIREVANGVSDDSLAYDAQRDLALELMFVNRRNDAVRQNAMEQHENAAAAARLAHVDWSDYPYPAILVPGHSPEIAYEPLNPNAVLRLRRGVERFRAGEAPVIIVSGGNLRPIGTVWTEALEMKKYLMEQEGVPENAILIDPLARHTTTNMRNTGRLMARYGIPWDRPSLVVGNSVPYIASQRFEQRNLRELGYMPFEPGRRLDLETLEFTPTTNVFFRDASDPMDP